MKPDWIDNGLDWFKGVVDAMNAKNCGTCKHCMGELVDARNLSQMLREKRRRAVQERGCMYCKSETSNLSGICDDCADTYSKQTEE